MTAEPLEPAKCYGCIAGEPCSVHNPPLPEPAQVIVKASAEPIPRDDDMITLQDWVDENRELRAQLVAATERAEEFKRIGQEFERQSRAFFDQSCTNLKRAEAAEAALRELQDVLTQPDGWASRVMHARQIVAKALAATSQGKDTSHDE